ncbi:MAG: hypothetical protein IPO05_13815 [Flavobacteriales bacterium]|nr:hypothetical protein [Flavobacteriales bacterium]
MFRSPNVNTDLSKPGEHGLQRHLDRAEVLSSTVAQLRKDLAQDDASFPEPPVGEEAFERLRAQVLPILSERLSLGMHDLQVAMYRVDIPEAHLKRTLAAGGLDALAGECVLRALQKVLTRLRFAGRY